MAYRRRFSGRSRFSGSRFRGRRRGVSWSGRANEPRKWEVANFYITQSITTGEGLYSAHYTPIAQIQDHLGDDATSQGRLMADMLRFVDVGGIVFSWKVFLNQEPTAALSNWVPCFGALCADRLDSLGQPTGIPDLTVTTPPIVLASSVPAGAQDSLFPSRILWRETRVLPCGGTNYNADNQVYFAGSRSLRLKLRLDDKQALFFNWGVVNNAGSSVTIGCVFSGTLYWRSRF